MKHWKEKLDAHFRRLIFLLFDSNDAWVKIADEEEHNYLRYLTFWISLCVGFTFVSSLISDTFTVAFIRPVVLAAILVLAVYTAMCISQWSFRRIYNMDLSDEFNHKLIAHSFSMVFVVRLVLAVAPSFFFIRILALFSIYILRTGINNLLPVGNGSESDENAYYKYLAINSMSIIFLPFIYETIFKELIFRNLQLL